MSIEQARALAGQQGVTLPTQNVGSGSPPAATRVVDTAGMIDAKEGSVAPRASGTPSSEVEAKPKTLVRWGQGMFRDADPSLFASHVGAVGGNYQLGPGDQIILTVWGEKEARYDLVLDRDGQVRLELVGAISLNGQTLRSAEELLRKRLAKVYSGMNSGATQMDLTMGKLKQVRVFVVGDVERPGSYLLSGNTSVFAALYQARGLTDLGSERSILLVRGGREIRIDLYDYLARGKRPAQDVLQDGDVIRVPRVGKLVQITGDVGRPGKYELVAEEGAKALLQYAGGANATTASTNMVATRVFPNGRREAVVLPSPLAVIQGADAALSDLDSIQVFAGVDEAEASVVVKGVVRYPGTYPWVAGFTVTELVKLAGGALPTAFTVRALVTRPLPDGSSRQYRFDLRDSTSAFVLSASDQVEIFDVRDLTFRRTVRISGAVVRPDVYEWREGMTAKDLILQAGGFRPDAEFGKVRVELPLMGSRGASEELLDLDSSLSLASADRPLVPDAHLSIPVNPRYSRMELVEVRGWVAHPGSYALRRTDERLSEVLARAGGVQPEGYASGSRLLRSEGNVGRIQVKFVEALKSPGSRHDLVLRGGDTILVPKQPATVAVRGRVNNPGNIIWTEGKSWKWYVQQAGGLADSAYEDGIYVEFADGWVETNDGGISRKPDAGAQISVPQRAPPEPFTWKSVFEGTNMVLGTVIAGLTILVLLNTTN